MGKEDECKKIEQITLFVSNKDKVGKLAAIIDSELRFRLYEKRERIIDGAEVLKSLTERVLCEPGLWDMENILDFGECLLKMFRNGRRNIVRKENLNVSLENEVREKRFDIPSDCDHVKDYENQEAIDAIRNELETNDDSIAVFVLEAVLQGRTNKEIASEFKLGISDVENANKRIRRTGRRIFSLNSGKDYFN